MRTLFFCLLFLKTLTTYAQDTIIPLWPVDKIPNRIESDEKEVLTYGDDLLRISTVQEPAIEVYLPAKANANGQAMLIFPGGGYKILAYDWEGTDIAKFLNGKGIAGIVVKYRLPSSASQKNKHNVPLIDAQRALRLVRSNAAEFNIDASKIGILGFSAGGHLAATLGTHFKEEVYAPIDEIDTESARPDFMALGYAVISYGAMTHRALNPTCWVRTPNLNWSTIFRMKNMLPRIHRPPFCFTPVTMRPCQLKTVFCFTKP